MVAPVRERGLKCFSYAEELTRREGRSREGAWIEIAVSVRVAIVCSGRSREGAWIEIFPKRLEEPLAGGRSREGAWIEIEDIFKLGFVTIKVAPVRERGLKS